MTLHQTKRINRGFTLVELITVMGIIGMLLAVVIASISQARQHGQDSARTADIANLVLAAKFYALEHHTYDINGSGVGGGVSYTESGYKPVGPILVASSTWHGAVPTDPSVPSGSQSSGGHYNYLYFVYSSGAKAGGCFFAELNNQTYDPTGFATAKAKVVSAGQSILTTNPNHMNYGACTSN